MERVELEKKCASHGKKKSKTLQKKCETFEGAYPLRDYVIRFTMDIDPIITFSSVIKAEDVL